jgi:hypothetical protein
MYKKHCEINTPELTQEIWRYMDLWKFLDIIDNSRMYLSQASQFQDKLDGRIPNHTLKSADKGHPLKQIDSFSESSLKFSHYISCWSSEAKETYPMWKVYSDYRTAVAIKTTVSDLIDSISEEEKDIYIGKIKYVNPNENYLFNGNTFQFFFEKRDYFSFENEIRILTTLEYNGNQELLKLPPGTFVKTKPEFIIKEIKLAPLASDSFKNLIELKLSNAGLRVPVSFSEI